MNAKRRPIKEKALTPFDLKKLNLGFYKNSALKKKKIKNHYGVSNKISIINRDLLK